MVAFTTNSVLLGVLQLFELYPVVLSLLGRHLELRERGNFDITDKRSGWQEN
jgi:hypothetical protein